MNTTQKESKSSFRLKLVLLTGSIFTFMITLVIGGILGANSARQQLAEYIGNDGVYVRVVTVSDNTMFAIKDNPDDMNIRTLVCADTSISGLFDGSYLKGC